MIEIKVICPEISEELKTKLSNMWKQAGKDGTRLQTMKDHNLPYFNIDYTKISFTSSI